MHSRLKLLNLFISTHAPKQNSSHFPIITPRQKEITRLPQAEFFENLFPPGRKGGREGNHRAEEITKIELMRVLATSFVKSHHLCTLHFSGFYFVAP